MVIAAQSYADGDAVGPALVLSVPLSFWGGIDVETGRIIDHSHPDLGEIITDRILIMPGGRGSSSASSVFAESVRRRTGPAGIILAAPDPILTVGALVAQSLYAMHCPVVVCAIESFITGQRVRIRAASDGRAEVSSPATD